MTEEQKIRIAELEQKLDECEKNGEITHRYLLEEVSKVKQAKAKLRFSHMKFFQNSLHHAKKLTSK